MLSARILAAHGAFLGTREREAQRIHMAGFAVLRAAIRTRRVVERLEVADAVPQPVLHAWA